MATIHELGNQGEDIAIKHLSTKGYSIVRKNYRHKNKEIDIIAENSDFIVFVEVKTRSGFIHEAPEIAVNKRKQNFLIAAANYFLLNNNIDKEARFDIIAITIKKGEISINHIENAFLHGI